MDSLSDEPTIEAGLTRYEIHGRVIDPTLRFLRETGEAGYEGVVAWIGTAVRMGRAAVTRAFVPEQIPYRGPEGVSVLVPGHAITKLISALRPDERVLIRVHSHPTFAHHSDTDDLNMLVSHVGAISLVVPYYARRGIDLAICSLNELQANGEWEELSIDEVVRRFTIL